MYDKEGNFIIAVDKTTHQKGGSFIILSDLYYPLTISSKCNIAKRYRSDLALLRLSLNTSQHTTSPGYCTKTKN